MSELPEGISADRDRDLAGRGYEPWVRRVILALVLFAVARRQSRPSSIAHVPEFSPP